MKDTTQAEFAGFRELLVRTAQSKDDRELLISAARGTELLTFQAAVPDLMYVAEARFEASSGRIECAPSTRKDVLGAIYHCLGLNSTEYKDLKYDIPYAVPVLWINGLAGTGKSTLAQTIAQECQNKHSLGASFFCARVGDRSNIQLIFPTIARQLARLNAVFSEALRSAVRDNPQVHIYPPARQLQLLIVEPLRIAKSSGSPIQHHVIVIDALDECRDSETISVIISALSLHVDGLDSLQIVLTSRPEANIDRGFRREEIKKKTHSFRLEDVSKEEVRKDIEAYLRSELNQLRSWHDLLQDRSDWPGNEKIARLCELSKEYFIFAATTVKFISGGRLDDPDQLLSIVLSSNNTQTGVDANRFPFAALDKLYLQVLQIAFEDSMSSADAENVRNIVGSVVLIFDQLSPTSLNSLLGLSTGATQQVLRYLGSVLVLPQDKRGVIEIVHPSFTDFIIDRLRCTLSQFTVSPPLQHAILAMRCLEVMNSMLTKDMVGLGNAALNSEVADLQSRIAARIPKHLLYACKNWMEHMRLAHISSDILGVLDDFCNQHMLQWLEVMSVIGSGDLALCSGLKAVQNVIKVDRMPYPPYFYSQLSLVGCVSPKYILGYTTAPRL